MECSIVKDYLSRYSWIKRETLWNPEYEAVKKPLVKHYKLRRVISNKHLCLSAVIFLHTFFFEMGLWTDFWFSPKDLEQILLYLLKNVRVLNIQKIQMTFTSCPGWSYKFVDFAHIFWKTFWPSQWTFTATWAFRLITVFSKNFPFDVETRYYAHKSEEERITSKMIFYAEKQFSL